MEKKEQLYEGKAKKVFATDDPNLVIVDYKDDATAFNGLKKGSIAGKGVINNVMSNHMFQLLEKQGVPTHFVEQLSERVYKIGDMNEKPTLEEKFSNFAILGRYVLTPAIFDILEHTAPGRNNEIQLTDGMKELCLHEPMCAVDFEGRRYDTGNLKGYLEAIIDFALKNDEAGEWLRQFIIDKAELLK